MLDGNQEKVGYCNPPKEWWWPKGLSGNPSGKRKFSNDFGEVFRRVAQKKTHVIENGKSRRVTMIEAVTRAPLINALKKNRRNIQYALELMEEFGTEVWAPPNQQLDRIYRDYDGKLKVKTRRVPRQFERLFAEFERKDAEAAKVWLRQFIRALQAKSDG